VNRKKLSEQLSMVAIVEIGWRDELLLTEDLMKCGKA
jgi:hypothetical protein